jgi:small subunit ribosomal protein S9
MARKKKEEEATPETMGANDVSAEQPAGQKPAEDQQQEAAPEAAEPAAEEQNAEPAAEEQTAEPAADAQAAEPAAEEQPAEPAADAQAAEPAAVEQVPEPADEQQTAGPAADAPVADTPAEPAAEEASAEEEPVAETGAPTDGDAAALEPVDADRAAEPEPARTLVELAADARYSATGKRKSAVARVILLPGSGTFVLNGKPLDSYFPRRTLQEVVRQPLKVTGYLDRVDIRARIHGGGISSQADAVRHGIAKALIEADPHLRGELKRRQFLTRDPRVKERRKAGLKKARKRPQFSKR